MFFVIAAAAASTDASVLVHLDATVQALRAADTEHLSSDQAVRRAQMIAALDAYASAGQFPHNHHEPEGHAAPGPVAGGLPWEPGRTPVFVDEHGTHCAVGYLLAIDGRGDLVASAVRADNTGYVSELASTELESWASRNGLSLAELERIQPSYGFIHSARARVDKLAGEVSGGDCSALFTSTKVLDDYRYVSSGQDGVASALPAPILLCIDKEPSKPLSLALVVEQEGGKPRGSGPMEVPADVCTRLRRVFDAQSSKSGRIAEKAAKMLESCPVVDKGS